MTRTTPYPQPHSFSFGGIRCSTHTIPQLLHVLRERLAAGAGHALTVNCLNAHIYCLAARHDDLANALNRSDVVAADGISIVRTAGLFGERVPARCNMTEAFRAFLADATMPASRALLIGARQKEAEAAAAFANRHSNHCHVVHAVSGFESADEHERILKNAEAIDLVLIGMGTPRSEHMVIRAAELCPDAAIWHIGGGTIRFLAGTTREAPAWMRACGLQWLYRLVHEPRRTWRRYVIGIPLFFMLLMRTRLCRTESPGRDPCAR